MISIYIQGLNDGKHKFAESVDVERLELMAEEFVGEIKAVGELIKRGDSYIVRGKATCLAKFQCDISLEDYEENITIDFAYNFSENAGNVGDTETTQLIDKDSKYIDITDEIRQDLIMALPMKTVAPKYRDKSFEEIFPQFAPEKKEETASSVWDALKKLKTN